MSRKGAYRDLWRRGILIAASGYAIACGGPAVLGDFNHQGATAFICTHDGNCTQGPPVPDTRWQQSNTTYLGFTFPCTGRVRRVLIQDPGSKKSDVFVECAPPESDFHPITAPSAH